MKSSKRRSKSRSSSRVGVEPDPIIPKLPHRVDHILCTYFKDLSGKLAERQSHHSTVGNELMTLDRVEECQHEDTVEGGTAAGSVDEILVSIKSKLDAYSQLEKHLQQAQAKALTEDERQLSLMREDFPGYSDDNMTLPMRQPSLISDYLNESLLKEHGLIIPSECIPPDPTIHVPPKANPPSYLNSTVTFDQHAKVKPSDIKHEKQKELPTSSSAHQWKNTSTAIDKELSRVAVAEIQRKVTFLHNPRQSAHKHVNTSSHGHMKKNKKVKDTNMFIAEPSHVLFTDYTPGKIYEQSISFRNVSGASRQIRIIHPKSPHFKVTIVFLFTASFPNSEGIIAPGMSCTYTVQFLPDSLANFTDEIQVVMHTGECLIVPLKGHRPSPELSIPSSLQCGHCLVGGCNTIVLPCCNNGGEGGFRISVNERMELVEGVAKLGPFTISPVEFHLLPGDSIDMKVEFRPIKPELYSIDFQMDCDNGETLEFIVSGTGDVLSVECVYISQSSTSISTAIKYAESAGYTANDWSAIDGDHEGVESVDSLVQFECTNPGVPLYKIGLIKNNSGVSLSYRWCFYHPCTELSSPGTTTISPLVPVDSDCCVFSVDEIDEQQHVLLPGQTKLVPIQYKPMKASEDHVMAFLQLDNIPMESLDHDSEGWSWLKLDNNSNTIASLLLELKGYAEPYNIQLTPALISIPDGLPPLTEKKVTVKVFNDSISPVYFEWESIHIDQCSVSIQPSAGTIVSGGSQYCECRVISTSTPGSYSLPLHCHITNDNVKYPLHVMGRTQDPCVTVSCPSIQYGLIQLNNESTQSIKLFNDSKCIINYSLRQIVTIKEEADQGIVDYSCISFSSSSGSIPPSLSEVINVTCTPTSQCGRLRSAIEVAVNGKKHSLIPMSAEVQTPSLVLEQASVYLDCCYIGIPHNHQITIINRGLLPAHYKWINNMKYDHCHIEFTPASGSIGPKQSTVVSISSTWNTEGYHSGVIAVCEVECMSEPLLLSISSRVHGLTIQYTLQDTTIYHTSDDELVLDYGSCNPIGQPQQLQLMVTNTSAVSTTIHLSIQQFKAHQQTAHDLKEVKQKKSGLLRITNTIVNPSTKTEKQTKLEICESLLSDGRGCALTVSPSQCDLSPFQSKPITITAYSDMWGSYKDHLICKIDGIKSRYFPITYGVIGSPIVFQTTATSGQTIVRFGSQTAGVKPVKRNLKLINTSSSDIRVDWRVFNYFPNDDKLVDLITCIGDPFPLLLTDYYPTNDDHDNMLPHLPTPLIKSIIQPHEGVPSPGYPFTIETQQMIFPPKSSLSVSICFNPSIESYNELGEHIRSYILGYYTLDTKSPTGCVRLGGYDIIPLRIDMTATIQHPKLTIETDFGDPTFTFNHAASQLIGRVSGAHVVRPSVTLSHDLTLTNLTDTILTYRVGHLSHPYSLHIKGTEDSVTLRPHQKIKGEVGYVIEHTSIMDQESTDTCITSTDDLVITFNTGAIQRFPLVTRILLPHLSIHPSVVDYGVVHLPQSHTAAVQLRNESSSLCVWQASIPSEFQTIVHTDPECGILGISDNEEYPLISTIKIIFTPRTETDYSIDVNISELITNTIQHLTIVGRGSVDEGVVTRKKKK